MFLSLHYGTLLPAGSDKIIQTSKVVKLKVRVPKTAVILKKCKN